MLLTLESAVSQGSGVLSRILGLGDAIEVLFVLENMTAVVYCLVIRDCAHNTGAFTSVMSKSRTYMSRVFLSRA